jgi:hypothetical protein
MTPSFFLFLTYSEFFKGTYEFVSYDLENGPPHHGGHDLDSLWWSMNTIPLTFKGPGGMKRKDVPLAVINKYYSHGPQHKVLLMQDFQTGGNQLDAMLAEYSDYFDDLKDFMRKWFSFLPIALRIKSYEHYHPHRYVIKIIDEAIQKLTEKQDKAETGYEKDAEEELVRREKERADMAEAVCKQITVPILLKRKDKAVPAAGDTPPSTPAPNANLEPSTTITPASPEHNTSSLTTVESPGRDRAVKRARSGTYRRNADD